MIKLSQSRPCVFEHTPPATEAPPPSAVFESTWTEPIPTGCDLPALSGRWVVRGVPQQTDNNNPRQERYIYCE